MDEQTTAHPKNLTRGQALRLDLYFWLQALAIALVTLIVLFTTVGRVISVDGNSMVPTLHHMDLLLLQSAGYTPRQNDVVVLTKPFGGVDGPIVKRVIAVGGQTVDIDYTSGAVAVDGQVLDEYYLNEPMEPPSNPYAAVTSLTVPEGCIFVMGDNRNHSSDSRDARLGVIDQRCVLGRAVLIVLPLRDFGPIR
ncbi:signal peptidase I [Pseudoflavonifractor sp. 524-17]|uniref:signal peptidase I n=1 Tax=Pseudoflavonifractor sp. 524-17 TaxID=2304577 RepID=UPI00137B272C|nr:signal peptidase I [Pseudoflavonifractor sp. 524-17]NCE63086.1 signal peptidase I [Pseudoflavonifractor sp. 524-17]